MKATLPCGLSFEEYVDSYSEARREKGEELAREHGMRDAELMHQATRLLLEETHQSIVALRDHRLNWREHMLTELMLAGLAEMKDSQEGGHRPAGAGQ